MSGLIDYAGHHCNICNHTTDTTGHCDHAEYCESAGLQYGADGNGEGIWFDEDWHQQLVTIDDVTSAQNCCDWCGHDFQVGDMAYFRVNSEEDNYSNVSCNGGCADQWHAWVVDQVCHPDI